MKKDKSQTTAKVENPKSRRFSRPNVAIKHQKILDNLAENGGSMRKAITAAGYSQEMADNPTRITDSKTWGEVLEQALPDSRLTETHDALLKASRLDHMVFGLGPKKNSDKKEGEDVLSDEDIGSMLEEVNCTLRRIVHGETARHVYFWSNDNRSRKDALDMAYKLKGRYGDENTPRSPHGNTYNFIFSEGVQEKVKVIEGEIKDLLANSKPNVQEN